jgi:hypothetical protein
MLLTYRVSNIFGMARSIAQLPGADRAEAKREHHRLAADCRWPAIS